jgi:hypothetical protein
MPVITNYTGSSSVVVTTGWKEMAINGDVLNDAFKVSQDFM